MKAPALCFLSCCIGAVAAAPAFGGFAVTVNAVGPGVAKAGDTVVIDFMITADPAILLLAYQITPPCALAPQDGATGTVDGAVIGLDVVVIPCDGAEDCTAEGSVCEDGSCTPHLRSDWAMCGSPCNCACSGFGLLDFGDCDGRHPRVGWVTTFESDSAAVGVGPAYLAHVEYTVSDAATGSFDFEFVDPEKGPADGTGSVLRDPDKKPIFADWVGTKLVIVECTGDDQCDDDGIDCTVDTCAEGSCNVPDDDACDNGNECTDGACNPASGCEQTNNSDPCDDGLFCNGDDTCGGGSCSVHAGDPCAGNGECADNCDEADDDCFGDEGAACTDDGNACTEDVCDGAGACTHPDLAAGTACGDGGDTDCDDPDTCDGMGTCLENNEPDGTSCPDDGNDCTDDECDGAGVCDHPNLVTGTPCGSSADTDCDNSDTCDGQGACKDNNEPAGTACDDGEECTVDDQCTGEPENDCAGEYQVQVYADICEPFDPPNGPQPDLDDIRCLLDDFADGPAVDGCICDGFRNTTDLHPCPEDGGGEGSIGLDDVMNMLDAFGGLHPCPDPCP